MIFGRGWGGEVDEAAHGLLYDTAPHVAETGRIKPAGSLETNALHCV